MTRDQLEARAWTIAQRLVSVIPQERCDAMDELLTAADEYATFTGGITAERRTLLAAEAREYAAAHRAAS